MAKQQALSVDDYVAKHLTPEEAKERAFRQQGKEECYCYVEGRYVGVQKSGYPAVFIAPENKEKLIALLLMPEKRPPCGHGQVQGQCELCRKAGQL